MLPFLPKTFAISEVMQGTHHFVDPNLGEPFERLFYFRIDWSGALPEALDPRKAEFMTFDTEGMIFVGGLTPAEVPCRGSMRVDYIHSKSIRYELDFEHDGADYHFIGEKIDINLLNPVMLAKTHTTCYGSLARDDGSVLSKSVTHFEPRAMIPFVMSFRLQ